MQSVGGYFDRVKFIGLAALASRVVSSVLWRNPKAGVAGAPAAAVAGGLLRGGDNDGMHWAAPAGLAFFLLHSLPW